jgi:SAM-dependent methyltransferase
VRPISAAGSEEFSKQRISRNCSCHGTGLRTRGSGSRSHTKVGWVAPAADLPGSEFSRSFGSVAARYAQYRPSYPDAAIVGVLDGLKPERILDLGAGTGKLTSSLIGRAAEVVAVDPDHAMLAELSRTVPQARAMTGAAEQIPLPDGSVDVIVVGQAYHWFAHPAADREMARVLRPGGVVGLLWNFPDRTVEWVTEVYRATRDDAQPPFEAIPLDAELFGTTEESRYPSAHTLDGPDGLINLAHTWSWVITRPADEQAAVDQRLRAVIDEYPELQGETVSIPLQTTVLRYRKR